MSTRDNDPLHAAINAKLASIVAASPSPPAWHDAWMALGPASTEEQRLAVYRAVRDSGCLPMEAGFYLVSWQIDAMASLDAEVSLCHLDKQLEAIEEAHGLEEDEFWLPGKAPQEYEELLRKYQGAWDRIFASKLEEFGEQEMAELFQADPDEFQRRSKVGQEFFHGPQGPEDADAPEWMYTLAEAVAGSMTADAPGRIGFRSREEDGLWELVMYPKPVELVGGAKDEEIVASGFSLDLEELRAEFERVDACSWQSLAYPNGEGPHVSIEGVYEGHKVFVQVLAYAPEDEEPGTKLDTGPRKA